MRRTLLNALWAIICFVSPMVASAQHVPLGGVVEDCVNAVGVDINTASPSLLRRVSGITPTIAKNLVQYREENGSFSSRKQIPVCL